MNNKAHLRPQDYDSNGDIIPMSMKEEKGDLISREALKKAVYAEFGNSNLTDAFNEIIDNAPTVDIKDQIAGAYNEGWMCGNREAEKARLQGKYVDISKLRLMTVEECAGHTIEYAMGWKACIEWLKKGGASNDSK